MSVPKIKILLASFQGAPFLASQLDSLNAQRIGPLEVDLSDDGSTDGTLAMVERNKAGWDRLSILLRRGPGQGAVENFRSLVLAQTDESSDYFAFCDQDDIWHRDKLARAIAWLDTAGGQPALFCGRTRILDQNGRIIGNSPLFARAPGFRNALVQSIAGGNTMVMNRAAFGLVRQSLLAGTPVVHDWWCYIIVSGAGGLVHYDPKPLVDYRQHAGNLIGANDGWRARLRRIGGLLAGRQRAWNDRHLGLLRQCAPLLTPEARAIADMLAEMHTVPLLRRLVLLRKSGLYRQSRMGQVGLIFGCLLGRI